MNVHISYKMAKAPDVEREFSQHVAKLERRLQVYRPELVHLHGNVDQSSSTSGAMVVSLNLRLPSGQMAAQEEGPTAVVAAKRAFSELTKQLTKHKEQLRSTPHRRNRKRNGEAHVPFEETFAAVRVPLASGEQISSYVNANVQQLMRFIERELTYRASVGQLEDGQLTAQEVLNEAVAQALSEDGEKPEAVSVGRWMYKLALLAIDEVAHQQERAGNVHLEDSVRKPNVRASDEPQLQFHQPDETLLMEDVVANRAASTPEEIAATDEFVRHLERSLLTASKEDREAFVLYAIEGFTLAEIATLSGRPKEQINTSLHSALEHVRKSMPVPPLFRERILRAARSA